MSIDVMKTALEALEKYCTPYSDGTHPADEAITALRLAIEQAEKQEPVAWMNDSTPAGVFARHKTGAENFGCTIPLYTAPRQRQPLTDEELVEKILAFIETQDDDYFDEWYASPRDFAATILSDFSNYLGLELVVPEYVPQRKKPEIDRDALFKALMPGIRNLFEMEYKKLADSGEIISKGDKEEGDKDAP